MTNKNDKASNSTDAQCKDSKQYTGKGRSKNQRRKRANDRNANGSKGSSSPTRSMTSYPSSPMSNDFEWYNKNPSLTVGVGQIPYPYRPGMELNLGSWALRGATENFTPHQPIPGFLALRYIPALGPAFDYQDAVNVASREIYARIRDAYSGNLAVAPADIMMYVGAIDSVYSEISHLKRIYGILNSYTSENYNYPDGALYAMGHSKEQIEAYRREKMILYTQINMLLARVRKYKLPSMMDLFKRHWWMAENIFADAPTLRSQMYFFHPDGAWKLGFDEQGTNLSYVYRDEGKLGSGVEGLVSLAKELLDALDASEDAYTMNGYLQRAFTDVPAFTVDDVDINYQVVPQYNPEVLLQIMNFTIASGDSAPTYTNWKYVQDVDKQLIKDEITFTVVDGDLNSSTDPRLMLRQDVDNPMVGDTVIATRMMNMIDIARVGTVANTYHLHFGTEICSPMRFATWNPTKQIFETRDIRRSFLNANTDLLWPFIANLSRFNHAPAMYIYELESGTQNMTNLSIVGDYYNPTTIDQIALRDLHAVCALSELNAFGIYGK